MIQDRHFIYPHLLSHDEVCARIGAVLLRSKNAQKLMDPEAGYDHAMWRYCLEYDLNPLWPLVSLQRERSLLGSPADDPHDWLYALGYVGQDGPGQVNPRWNGLAPQLWLSIHQTAWIAGFGRAELYGATANLRPGATRWDPLHPHPIQLYGLPGVKDRLVTPASMPQHCIWTYTPHEDALWRFEQLAKQFAPEFL